jgi:ribosomal protein S30
VAQAVECLKPRVQTPVLPKKIKKKVSLKKINNLCYKYFLSFSVSNEHIFHRASEDSKNP